jgi:ferredoxin
VHDASETRKHSDVLMEDARSANVRFAASNREVACHEGSTLLEVAREAGLHIPSACLFSVCGACKVRKLEGKVHMVSNGDITDEDVQAGDVLACGARPLGDVVLDC